MKMTVFFSGVVRVVPAVLALGFAACTSNVPAPVVGSGASTGAQTARPNTHVVRAGDTFYSIAREYDMDPRELIGLNVNEVQNPDQLSVGQVLRVSPRSNAPVAVAAPVKSDVVVVRPIGSASASVAGRQPARESNTELLKREPKAGKEPYSEQALVAARSEKQQTAPVASVAAKPAAASGSKGPWASWIWPATGKVVTTFSQSGLKGIDSAGKAGDPVIAAGNGKVV
jgi:lipoprotein NlpD